MFCNGRILALAWIFGTSMCFGDSWFGRRSLGPSPGPSVIATRGEVWPKPHSIVTTDKFFIVRPNLFNFEVVGKTCDILDKALQRYKHELKAHDRVRRMTKMMSPSETRRRVLVSEEKFEGYLDVLKVDLRSPCEQLPHFNMDEHYELRINSDDYPGQAILVSHSIWGILRGLESWSHLIHISFDNNALLVNSTSIMDFPRFSHRGLLIDTSRHFLPTKTIYTMLDAMAMSKLNVLHWHVVDDQSFPFQSRTFPQLSAEGAYAPTHVYTPEEVQAIVAYAAERGIRVMPEFDTPGHTRSWGEGYPELLTDCRDGSLGPMNPIAPKTYDFMEKFMKEIKEVFPDSYMHLGGDEVEFDCWERNPKIVEYMKKNNLTSPELEEMFVNKIVETATNLSAKSVVWQEVFDNNVKLPHETLVHIWKRGFAEELNKVTKKGYKTLLSSCWYLDGLNSGGDWKRFYSCDPLDFHGSEEQKKLVVGGEACMWGEVVNVHNVVPRVWPRACAAAEVLWSSEMDSDSLDEAARRLEEHTCRMNRRKIGAQPPNGPGFCPGLNFA